MNETMIAALADQAGAPSHPVLFLVLGVITLALHLTAVSLMLGTLVMSFITNFSNRKMVLEMAPVFGFSSKVIVSLVIVLGVAPLLFVQVIYDPFWYTSNVLSAWWLIYFLVFLTCGYLLLYLYVWMSEKALSNGRLNLGKIQRGLVLLLALIMFGHCGFIMHSIANQALFPSSWMEWYAPAGEIVTTGKKLHYTLLPRVLFYLFLALPVTGAWLYAVRTWKKGSGTLTERQSDFYGSFAKWLCWAGSLILAGLAAWWMFRLPEQMAFLRTSGWTSLLVVPIVIFALLPVLFNGESKIRYGYWPLALSVVSMLLLCVHREAIRFSTLLETVKWNPLDYKVVTDWPSTIVFFVTFLVIGGLALGYMLTIAWQAWRCRGKVFVPGAGLNRLGSVCIWALVAWTIVYLCASLLAL